MSERRSKTSGKTGKAGRAGRAGATGAGSARRPAEEANVSAELDGDAFIAGNGSTGALVGRVAVITGAGQGIGEGIAALFAREGASLLLADLNEKRGRAVASHLKAAGAFGEVLFQRCDVAHAAEVRDLIAAAVSRHGRLDVLVNNAGYAVYKGVEATTEAEWQRVLDVNLSAQFYAIKYASPHLRTAHGAVVNVASIRALATTPEVFAYSAAKAGVLGLTRAAALDLAPDVRVNCILPGAIDTPMHRENVAATGDLAAGLKAIRERIPMQRHGQPADIARAALFLATDASQWVTGASFVIDGGHASLLT